MQEDREAVPLVVVQQVSPDEWKGHANGGKQPDEIAELHASPEAHRQEHAEKDGGGTGVSLQLEHHRDRNQSVEAQENYMQWALQ